MAILSHFSQQIALNKWKPISHNSRANAFRGQTLKTRRNKYWNGNTVDNKPAMGHLQFKNLNQLSKNHRDYLQYYKKPEILSNY